MKAWFESHTDSQLNNIADGAFFRSILLVESKNDAVTVADQSAILPAKVVGNHVSVTYGSAMVSGVMHRGEENTYVEIMSADACEWNFPPFLLMPPVYCGSFYLEELSEVALCIEDANLIRLLNSVFLDERVCRPFLELNASSYGEFNEEGGLAAHTLDVAQRCLNCESMMTSEDRDVLLTAALLHHIWRVFKPSAQYEDFTTNNEVLSRREQLTAVRFMVEKMDAVMDVGHLSRIKVAYALTAMNDGCWAGLMFSDCRFIPKLLRMADEYSKAYGDDYIDAENDRYAREIKLTPVIAEYPF